MEACDILLAEGRQPTISQVVALSGYSASTVNRARYRSLVRAARACFGLVEGGMSLEEARAVVGESMPLVDGSSDREPSGRDGRGIAEEGGTMAVMLHKIAKLTAEVERRDEQLYHALAVVRGLRETLQWHRARTAELERQLDGLSNVPLPARVPKRWNDDMEAQGLEFEGEDD
jgi:xanthine/CO dehydrogenase XdhC/CoxF family maturation factor